MINRIAIIFLVFFMTGCIGADPQKGGYGVTIPLAKINQTFASQFPAQVQSSYGAIKMYSPQLVAPKTKDTMQTGASFSLKSPMLNREIGGNISLSSGVRFDYETKNVYLANPMIEDLTLDNVALSQFLTPQAKEAIGDILAQVAMRKPIYNLNKSGIMGVNLVRDVAIAPEGLVVTFGL